MWRDAHPRRRLRSLVNDSDVDVAEVRGGYPGPGRTTEVRGLGVHLDVPGRLVMPGPQAARRRQVGGSHLVLGVTEEDFAGRRGPGERLAQRRRPRNGTPRSRSPPAGRPSRRRRLRRPPASGNPRPGGPGPGGVLRRAHQVLERLHGDPALGHHTDGAADDGDDGDLVSVAHTVGGEGVVGPPQVGVGDLVIDDHTGIRLRELEGPFDQYLGAGRGHRPLSSEVLRTCTCRNKAAGQP